MDKPPPFHRVKPLVDTTARMPIRDLLSLVFVETVGIGIILSVSWLFQGDLLFPEALLVPPLVSYVLIVSQPQLPGCRPLRVLGSYALVGFTGIFLSLLPLPNVPLAIISGATALLLMYTFGVFHAPAFAIPFAAIIDGFALSDAPREFGMLMVYTALVIGIAIATNRLLGYRSYPDKWW